MNKKFISNQRKKRGVPSRKELYARVAPFAKMAIKTLVDIMRSGDTDAVRLGAAKVILAKVLPDLKAEEVREEQGRPLGVVILPEKNYKKVNLSDELSDEPKNGILNE